jgi:hypothetical protein
MLTRALESVQHEVDGARSAGLSLLRAFHEEGADPARSRVAAAMMRGVGHSDWLLYGPSRAERHLLEPQHRPRDADAPAGGVLRSCLARLSIAGSSSGADERAQGEKDAQCTAQHEHMLMLMWRCRLVGAAMAAGCACRAPLDACHHA